jgi:VanZ family protein
MFLLHSSSLERARSRGIQITVQVAFGVLLMAILAFTLLPVHLPDNAAGGDKIQHLTAFMVLTLLGLFGWPTRAVDFVVGLTLLGAGIEVVQSVVGRDMQLSDWIADFFGVLIGLILASLARRASRLRR